MMDKSKKAYDMILEHIENLNHEILISKDSTNKAILQQAKSTALQSLANLLVG